MTRAVRIELTARNVVVIVVVLAAFGLLVAVGARRFDRAPHAASPAEHGVETRQPEHRLKLAPEALANARLELLTAGPLELSVGLSLPGEVALNQDKVAHVTPRVTGTAREVKKQIGERVTTGEVLALLDSRDLAEAQRDFLATKERLGLAEATFARAELLQKENISAEKDFLAAKQALAEAQIEHRSAAQKLRAIGGGSGPGAGYALVAPFTGTIIEKHISVGEVLSEETRAFTIADLSTIWVNVTVYAKDLPKIAVGQAAEVRAEGIAEPAQGNIVYLGQIVGEQTRSATARVVLKDPGPAWRPGLFATADVTIDRSKVEVAVADDAVQTLDAQQVVFVQEQSWFEARPVKLGRRGRATGAGERRQVEVIEGVKAGERYVARNSFILKADLGKSEAAHEH